MGVNDILKRLSPDKVFKTTLLLLFFIPIWLILFVVSNSVVIFYLGFAEFFFLYAVRCFYTDRSAFKGSSYFNVLLYLVFFGVCWPFIFFMYFGDLKNGIHF